LFGKNPHLLVQPVPGAADQSALSGGGRRSSRKRKPAFVINVGGNFDFNEPTGSGSNSSTSSSNSGRGVASGGGSGGDNSSDEDGGSDSGGESGDGDNGGDSDSDGDSGGSSGGCSGGESSGGEAEGSGNIGGDSDSGDDSGSESSNQSSSGSLPCIGEEMYEVDGQQHLRRCENSVEDNSGFCTRHKPSGGSDSGGDSGGCSGASGASGGGSGGGSGGASGGGGSGDSGDDSGSESSSESGGGGGSGGASDSDGEIKIIRGGGGSDDDSDFEPKRNGEGERKGKGKRRRQSGKKKYAAPHPCFGAATEPKTPGEKKHVATYGAKSSEAEKIRPKQHNESRYITKRMVENVFFLSPGEDVLPEIVSPETFHRMEKDDPALHGIVVSKTTVTSPKKGKGTVVGFERRGGYWVYTIRWGRTATVDGKYSTLEVLKEADEGTATSLEETYRSMIDYMCVMLYHAYVDTHEAVKDDVDRKVDKHQFVTLEGDDLARARKVRRMVWNHMQKMKAADTLTEPDLRLLGDEQLVTELRETKIYDVLRVKQSAKGDPSEKAGLVRDEDLDFCDYHLTVANHLLKTLQAAFRVGRLPTRESANLTLTLGEIPLGVNLRACDQHETSQMIPLEDRTASKYGLPMRALIARASRGLEGWCYFSKYCPILNVLTFTRPEELGQIQATSQHSNDVAKCRKSVKFLRHFWTFTSSPTQHDDNLLLTEVFEGYKNGYAARVGVARERVENALKKKGHGIKVAKGRVPHMSPEELARCLDMIDTVVGRNCCGDIMEAVGEAEIAMCQDVLLVHPNTIGYTSNEDLFMPGKHEKEIRKIVKRLKGKFGVDEVRF
jgi:hypothetical protein